MNKDKQDNIAIFISCLIVCGILFICYWKLKYPPKVTTSFSWESFIENQMNYVESKYNNKIKCLRIKYKNVSDPNIQFELDKLETQLMIAKNIERNEILQRIDTWK